MGFNLPVECSMVGPPEECRCCLNERLTERMPGFPQYQVARGLRVGWPRSNIRARISDPSGGAADHQHHLRYTISQASPALRWIAWGSSDPGGDPGGDPKRFPVHIWPDTPSLRELVASTAPPGSQDPRSKPRLRARPRRRPGHDGGARATCCPIWRVGDIIWQS